MKQKKKTETMKHLTDAELRQVTGGANIDDYDDITDYWEAEKQRCEAPRDKANCVKQPRCKWKETEKDSYCCWDGICS